MLFRGETAWVPYLVWLAAGFDFLDGFAARLLKVSSPIGAQLDSLADMVTFGVLPGLLVTQSKLGSDLYWVPATGLLIVVCSALRLARFNVDDTQTEEFKGLATPANALFFTSLPLLDSNLWIYLTGIDWILGLLAIAFSLLMVSSIPFFAFKFKGFGWKQNQLKYIFILIALIALVLLQQNAIPAVILGYVLLSVGRSLLSRA